MIVKKQICYFYIKNRIKHLTPETADAFLHLCLSEYHVFIAYELQTLYSKNILHA